MPEVCHRFSHLFSETSLYDNFVMVWDNRCIESVYLTRKIEYCAEDGCEEFFTEMHRVRITNLNDSIGIRLKSAVHLGKKFLTSISSLIVYCMLILKMRGNRTKTYQLPACHSNL